MDVVRAGRGEDFDGNIGSAKGANKWKVCIVMLLLVILFLIGMLIAK